MKKMQKRPLWLPGIIAVLTFGLPTALLANGPMPVELCGETSYEGRSRYYVNADSENDSMGTRESPFKFLKTAESESGPGDIICVFPSATVLDDGISLKEGQILIGLGADPTADPYPDQASGSYSTIQNSTGLKTDGDAVRCLGECTVSNIWITEAFRSGINAVESNGNLTVEKSRVEKFNLSKQVRRIRAIDGFALGVPFAGIIHSITEGVAETSIRDGHIADTPTGSDSCGYGIQILSVGDSHLTSKISNVTIANMEPCADNGQAPDVFQTARAISLIARNFSTHDATVEYSTLRDIGVLTQPGSRGMYAGSVAEDHDPGSALMETKILHNNISNIGAFSVLIESQDQSGGGGSSRINTEIIGNVIANTLPAVGTFRVGILVLAGNDEASAEKQIFKIIGNTVTANTRVIQAAYNASGTFETQILNNHVTQRADNKIDPGVGLDAISVTTLGGVVVSELTTISGNDVVIESDTQGSLGGILVGPLSTKSSGSVFSGLIDVTGNRVTLNSSIIPGLLNVTPGLTVLSNIAFDEIAVKDFDVLFADNCVVGNAPTPVGHDLVTGFQLASIVGGAFPAPSAANPAPITVSLVNNSFINTDFDIFYGNPEALFVPMPAINFEVLAQNNYWQGAAEVGCVTDSADAFPYDCADNPATVPPVTVPFLNTDNACNGCFGPGCVCIDDLTARAKSTKVQLVWGDTGPVGSYNIYRSTSSGGPYAFLANTTSSYSSYLDTGLTNGTTYYYVVREVALDGNELCQSNEVGGTPAGRSRRGR